MNKIILGIALAVILFSSSCTQDEELGKVELITGDYKLPQGKSPADDKVVELFHTFGSYFLYEFQKQDFEWSQVYNSDLKNTYAYTPADPQYVGDMLELLNEIWFKFYPKEFLKKSIPYRVYLVSTLEQIGGTTSKPVYSRAGSNQIAISLCSDTLRKMSRETKIKFRNELQYQLLNFWKSANLIEFPSTFYSISSYTPDASWDSESNNYTRKRGFVASVSGKDWSTMMYSSMLGESYIHLDMQRDLDSYIQGMMQRTSQDWEKDLAYPVVKKKYDLLRNHFKEKYSFDLQAIGDAIL